MNFLVVGGFLGSGKTSALLPLARHIVETSASDSTNKVMILENEVGEIGIDDAFLRGGGFQVDTLFSGCACCPSSESCFFRSLLERASRPSCGTLSSTTYSMPRSSQMRRLSSFPPSELTTRISVSCSGLPLSS